MAQALEQWIESEVRPLKEKSVGWLSQYHFFRDPMRAVYDDPNFFFSPADGVLLYQKELLSPDEALVEIKGKGYTLREALQNPTYDKPSLVVGVFMTFFDVHVNRVPYSGLLSFEPLDPIDTLNHPMLSVEKGILDDLRIGAPTSAEYLYHNKRVVNRVDVADLKLSYYVLQIADYDVDAITPFNPRQKQPFLQSQRFSHIRFGSQVDLIIPLADDHDFTLVQQTGTHVKAGIDPLVRVDKI